MTVTAEQAQPGRRYKTPRGSICTVEAVPAEGQVRLTMEAGGTVSVPRAYPLTPIEPAATGGTDLSLVAGKAPAVVEAALAGLTLAELDDLVDRDSRMFVLELVDRERKRRAGPEATGTDHDDAPVPDRDVDTDGDGDGDGQADDAPTSAACPTCGTEQPLVASTKHAGALVFKPHASPTVAYCPGSATVYERPTTTATAPEPAGPFGAGVLDAESRIVAVQRMTSGEQIAAARAVPGVQASVVRELDRQQAALEWVLEADGDMAALQARAGAHRLENRPGCLAVVRELIAKLRGLGVDPEPSVVPARSKGPHPDEVDAASDYQGEHAGLARRLRLLTGRAVWAWADLEAVAAMTGTVRASRAALRATGDHHLVRAAWLIERTGDNRDTVLGQLASRYSSLGCDASTLPTDPAVGQQPVVEQPAPEVPPAAVEQADAGEAGAEYDPEDSEHYWHGFEDFGAEVPRDQHPSDYDDVQADSWRRGWDAAKAEVPAVEQVPEPKAGRKADAAPPRDPLATPRPHDVAKLTRADGSTELWVVVGYSPDMNAVRGDGNVGVLVLTEHGEHPELGKAHGSYRRSGLVSWWASLPAEGERFEVVQTAVADTAIGGGWVPPTGGYDYSLPPGATNARGFPRPPDELLPAPWRDVAPAREPSEAAAPEHQVAVPWAEGELLQGDQVVVADHDGDGRELRRFLAELVNPDDNGALGLRWAEGRRHRDRRFSRHTGVAIGHGNGKGGLRILGRLERPVAAVSPPPAPAPVEIEAETPPTTAAGDLALPFAEQVARASLGRVHELIDPGPGMIEPDAELLAQALRAERAAGNREAVVAAIEARLVVVRRALADAAFDTEVAHLDTGEALALIDEHRGIKHTEPEVARGEVVKALALEAKVHNREPVIEALTAYLAATAPATGARPTTPADYPDARAWGNVAAERGEPNEPPTYDDPAARAAWSEGWSAWHAAVEADRAAQQPEPVAPREATAGEAAAARAAGKVAVQVADLRVLEHRRGAPELWAFPEGELPQRLGPVDLPQLAPYVAAVRKAGTDGAPIVPWRPASRAAPAEPPAPPPTAPASPLGALGEALGALKALGLRVDLRITSDDVKG